MTILIGGDPGEVRIRIRPTTLSVAMFGTRWREAQAEAVTQDVLDVFDGAGKSVAQDLCDLWAAFDRFCRTRIGLGGPAVFRAWQMPLLEDVESMLALHRDVKPQPKKVAEHQRLMNLSWDRRFGRGGDWYEGDDGDEKGDDDGE